jgi:hypothetical protein
MQLRPLGRPIQDDSFIVVLSEAVRLNPHPSPIKKIVSLREAL